MTTIGAAIIIAAILCAAYALVAQLRRAWGKGIERDADDDTWPGSA